MKNKYKRLQCLLCAVPLLCFVSCAATPQPVYEDKLQSIMDTVEGIQTELGDGPTYSMVAAQLDSYSVYMSRNTGGGNTFIFQHRQTGAVHYATFPFGSVTSIEQGENPNEMQVYSNSDVFGGDTIHYYSTARYVVDVDTGEILQRQPLCDWDEMLGLQRGQDTYVFGHCESSADTATFRFELVGEEVLPCGTEIYTLRPDTHEYVVLFNETSNLDNAFLLKLQAMEGIETVHARYFEEAMFTGTQLEITTQGGYLLQYYVNKSNSYSAFEDFNLVVVPYPA